MAGEKVMRKSQAYAPIQAFMLKRGQVNLTSGTLTGVSLMHCAAAGEITVTFADASDETIVCYAGDDFAIEPGASVVIDSGTFHWV